MAAPSFHFSDDGNMEILVTEPLAAISIENIVDLVSHEITHEAGVTLHLIQFQSGGLFRYLYTDEGEIKELSGRGIVIRLLEDNRLLIRDGPHS